MNNSNDRNYNVDALIVEDNQCDSELMVRSIQKLERNISYHIVSDGEEALDFIFCRNQYIQRDCRYALKFIFLDIKLPKIDGLQVLKELRKHKSTRLIPVIIISSSMEQNDISQAYASGANSYVVKPIEFDEYSRKLKQVGSYWYNINDFPREKIIE